MSTTSADTRVRTMADFLATLDGIPADRVRWEPTPGTATEEDLLRENESSTRGAPLELINNTLVEKAVGSEESELAVMLLIELSRVPNLFRLGRMYGADGLLRFTDRIRSPDISFVKATSEGYASGAIVDVTPDLAVEVLSVGNTIREMEVKRTTYLDHGTTLVWLVDPRKETVDVWTRTDGQDRCETLTRSDTLTAPGLFPEWELPLERLFSEFRREEPSAD